MAELNFGYSLADVPRRLMAGIPVDPLTKPEILSVFSHAVEHGMQIQLTHLNLHGLYAYFKSAKMRELFGKANTLVHIDGMPIVWLANLAGAPAVSNTRNAHIDLIPGIFQLCSEKGWKVVLVGSTMEGASENKHTFTKLFPNLHITCFDGFFDIDDKDPGSKQTGLVQSIQNIAPKLVLVGLGMPRQEEWILAVSQKINVPMIMPVGGFADYFTGRNKMPPRWLGRLGLEWVYRLATDPKRLAFRYLIEPFIVLFYLIRATLAGAKWGAGNSHGEIEEFKQ